jgi:hypothetical protein
MADPVTPENDLDPGQAEIEAVLGGLDRATRTFAARFEAGPPATATAAIDEAAAEARAYLERAKHRADSLIAAMIAAVEEEAATIRRRAEREIEEHWQRAEAEAGEYVADARRVADGMVAERQDSIGAVSDGILRRAEALTTGMDDAERIRTQFDRFILSLSETADRIASEARPPERRSMAEAASAPRKRSVPAVKRPDSLAA